MAFAVSAFLTVLIAALWASLAPLQASVCTVFLFAGPHNWMEARYFLARMPVRWVGSRRFFLTAIPGVLLLAAAQAALFWHPEFLQLWIVALCLWTALLWRLRARELQRDGSVALPIALAIAAAGVEWPGEFSVALVYLHPLVALWFLDRQIRVSRPDWIPVWCKAAWVVPAAALLVLVRLAAAPSLNDETTLAFAITQHAGSDLIPLSSHALVSTHVFLETIHYGVWIFAMPLLGLQSRPWRWSAIPLVRHREGWPRLVKLILLGGAAAALLLWACFLLDYTATRRVYFLVAVAHVLAEIPFLIRMRAA